MIMKCFSINEGEIEIMGRELIAKSLDFLELIDDYHLFKNNDNLMLFGSRDICRILNQETELWNIVNFLITGNSFQDKIVEIRDIYSNNFIQIVSKYRMEEVISQLFFYNSDRQHEWIFDTLDVVPEDEIEEFVRWKFQTENELTTKEELFYLINEFNDESFSSEVLPWFNSFSEIMEAFWYWYAGSLDLEIMDCYINDYFSDWNDSVFWGMADEFLFAIGNKSWYNIHRKMSYLEDFSCTNPTWTSLLFEDAKIYEWNTELIMPLLSHVTK